MGKRKLDRTVFDRRLELLLFCAVLTRILTGKIGLTDHDYFGPVDYLLFFCRIYTVRGATLVPTSLHEGVWALKNLDGAVGFEMNAIVENFLVTLQH